MEPLDAAALPAGALLLVDSAPIIYALEANAEFAPRFVSLFERHARGKLVLAVTMAIIAEVLAGPLGADEGALAKRYRATLETWQVVDFSTDIAESAARLRATYRSKLPDAIQLAGALVINADALVTRQSPRPEGRGLQRREPLRAGLTRPSQGASQEAPALRCAWIGRPTPGCFSSPGLSKPQQQTRPG